jgi:hypothetical protein
MRRGPRVQARDAPHHRPGTGPDLPGFVITVNILSCE